LHGQPQAAGRVSPLPRRSSTSIMLMYLLIIEGGLMNLTVYLPDDLAQEVRDADLPISTICQKALREALHGTTDPLERIAADLARIREALGIDEAGDQPPARQDEVDVATAILLEAAARRTVWERERDRVFEEAKGTADV